VAGGIEAPFGEKMNWHEWKAHQQQLLDKRTALTVKRAETEKLLRSIRRAAAETLAEIGEIEEQLEKLELTQPKPPRRKREK
jgi:hypothetical protein